APPSKAPSGGARSVPPPPRPNQGGRSPASLDGRRSLGEGRDGVNRPAGPASVKPPPGPATASRRPPPLPKSETTGASKVPAAASHPPEPPRISPEGNALVELLTARIERLAGTEDRVGLARARLELAIVHETIAEDAKVNGEIEAALKVDPDLAPAHAVLRRRLHHRTQLLPMLRHLEREIAVASGEAAAVELLVERARLLVAGEKYEDAREAWELVHE